MKQTELIAAAERQLATREPTPADMLRAVIDKGVTTENVAAVEQLVKLYERMEEKRAERDFAMAFTALQNDMPVIVASTVIPNRGKYERFEDLMAKLGPLLVQHGFSVSFTMDFRDNRILETCHLTHIGGFTRSNSFAVRSSGKADSETQSDCKAATTAKRNALCNALNIVIRQDCLNSEQDAAIEGGPISLAQAFALEARCEVTGSDKDKFLKFAGASKFVEIPVSKYDMLDALLKKKERR